MSEHPSRSELAATRDWLEVSADNENAGKGHRYASAAFDVALRELGAGGDAPLGSIDSEQIFDQANPHGPIADKRKRVKASEFVQYLKARTMQQVEWLQTNRPEISFYVQVIEVGSSVGGARNKKRYAFIRRPFLDAPLALTAGHELESDGAVSETAAETPLENVIQPPPPGTIIYARSPCTLDEITLWGRFLFSHGPVVRGSWRWRLLVSRFLLMLLIAGLIVFVVILLPAALNRGPSLGGLVIAAASIGLIYLYEIRSWVSIANDRITMASDSLLSGITPAQIEIRRNGAIIEWILVRYSSSCTVCGSTIHVRPGEPDFPRRLVGRCDESPCEHVFSFDRMTRLGRPLIAPPGW